MPKGGVFSDEHRRKLAEAGRRNGRKESVRRKNLISHLKYDVTLEWLSQFDDLDKIIYLNRSISRKRDCEGFTTDIYKSFIVRFYNDRRFNELYYLWKDTKDKWIKPSLDHIQSKSLGGSLTDIDNLQFISWFENRAKANISLETWNKMKEDIYKYL